MALIVPGMLVASLALLALAGGFGGLMALGQALAGPSAPVSTPTAARGVPAARPVPPALIAALSAPAASPRSGSTPAPISSAGGTTGAAAPVPSTSIGSRPRQPQPGGTGGTHAPARGGAPSSKPAPKPQPTVVDRVVSTATSVTSQIPGPAGSAATQALQTAGSTLDSIAPIKSR